MIRVLRTGPCIGTLVLILLLATADLAAQACIGYPQKSVGALSGGVGFPDDATTYSLSGMVSSEDEDFFVRGGFALTSPDEDAFENVKTVSGSLAYEVASLAPDVSVCPVAGASFSWVGDLNSWSVPFGVGVGSTIPLGRSGEAGLTPFAIPHFVYIRESVDDIDDSAVSDVFFGLSAGATVSVGPFFVSGGVSKIFEEELDAVFSIGLGLAWR